MPARVGKQLGCVRCGAVGHRGREGEVFWRRLGCPRLLARPPMLAQPLRLALRPRAAALRPTGSAPDPPSWMLGRPVAASAHKRFMYAEHRHGHTRLHITPMGRSDSNFVKMLKLRDVELGQTG